MIFSSCSFQYLDTQEALELDTTPTVGEYERINSVLQQLLSLTNVMPL